MIILIVVGKETNIFSHLQSQLHLFVLQQEEVCSFLFLLFLLLNLSILHVFVKHVLSVEFSKTYWHSGNSVLSWFSVCILIFFGGEDVLCGSRERISFWSAVEEEMVPNGVPF